MKYHSASLNRWPNGWPPPVAVLTVYDCFGEKVHTQFYWTWDFDVNIELEAYPLNAYEESVVMVDIEKGEKLGARNFDPF